MGICGSKDDPSVTLQSPTGHEQRPTKLEGKAPAVTNLSDRPDQLAPAGSDFQSPPRQADRRPSLAGKFVHEHAHTKLDDVYDSSGGDPDGDERQRVDDPAPLDGDYVRAKR